MTAPGSTLQGAAGADQVVENDDRALCTSPTSISRTAARFQAGRGLARERAGRCVAALERRRKGPRLYDWAYRPYRSDAAAGWAKGVLIRRTIKTPEAFTFYLTLAPPATMTISPPSLSVTAKPSHRGRGPDRGAGAQPGQGSADRGHGSHGMHNAVHIAGIDAKADHHLVEKGIEHVELAGGKGESRWGRQLDRHHARGFTTGPGNRQRLWEKAIAGSGRERAISECQAAEFP